MALTVKFYGTRGSIMSVSKDRMAYGGHTPCVTVNQDGEMVIIDAGFGIANLSDELFNKLDLSKGGYEFHIFLSHFHWDHIQGLQYFAPLYFKNKINLYSPCDVGIVKEVLNLLLDGSYSPFSGIESLPCEWNFVQLEQKQKIGAFEVTHHPTVHTTECYAYQLKTDEGRVAYISDHDANPTPTNEDLVEWSSGCDILIHEAMFTPSEYAQFPDLGHSSFVSVLQNAQRINPKLTLLTHHSPLRSDSELSEHERYLERLFNDQNRRLAFAREGLPYKANR